MKLISFVFAFIFSLSAFALQKTSVTPLEDSISQHYFGRVYVNQQVWARFQISNDGDEALLLEKIGIAGADYDAWSDCPEVIDPHGVCTVDIRFWPIMPGLRPGTFRMFGKDNTWNLYIRLMGEGV
jgi:hypothetical protein